MKTLIEAINELQEVFATVGSEDIQLPQIVAIGGQSAGKSSVIESIVGKSFLPRGTGIVTRCPLVLQLIQCPMEEGKYRSKDDGTLNIPDFGKFHDSDEIYKDFEEICLGIENRTDKLAGTNKGICHTEIILKIFSDTVPNLTLVDLPGTTKVPVGDQPHDIERQIKLLIFKYINNPNSIILAVHSANTDIATAESIKYAKEVDPEGLRTLAVLTKLDLMDAGTDANDMLSGRIIPVKLGIIGVVNRSQKDVTEKKKITDVLNDEKLFLKEKYPMLASINGTPYLSQVLERLLVEHVRSKLPELKERIRKLKKEEEDLLKVLGDDVVNPMRILMDIIKKFVDSYSASIHGTGDSTDAAGAEIFFLLFELYKNELNGINPLEDVNSKEIWKAMKYSSGIEPPIFVCESSFKSMVRKQIQNLKEPSLNCLERVHERMLKMIKESFMNDLSVETKRFPKIYAKICNIITDELLQSRNNAEKMIEYQMAIENSYVNVQHEDFREALKKLDKEKNEKIIKRGDANNSNLFKINVISNLQNNIDDVKKLINNHSLSAQETEEVNDVKFLIASYFEIVRKSFLDKIPKSIMHFLVYDVKNNMQTELMEKMMVEKEEIIELVKESSDVFSKRKQSQEKLKALKRANQILCKVNETSI